MKAQSLFVALSLTLALSACGGGGGQTGTAMVVPSTQVVPSPAARASATFAVPKGASTITLPAIANISGSLQLNVADTTENTHLTVTTVAATGARTSASISGRSEYTAQLQVDAPVHLHDAPRFTIDAPFFSGLAANDVTFDVYDDAAGTHKIASGTHAASITGSKADFTVDMGTTDLDPTRTYAITFAVATHAVTNAVSAVTRQAALFAVPAQDAVLAIDLPTDGTTPQFRLIKGPHTGLHNPVDIASGPVGEAVVLNKQEYDSPFGDVTTLRGSGVILAATATDDATPTLQFPVGYALLDHLTSGPTGIVYMYGSGDAGHQSEIDLLAGTNPTFGDNRPDIAGYRRFLSVNYAATAADGHLAATVSDYGDFGGFTFSEYALSIAGNADYLLLSSNVPGDKEVQRNLPLYDYQFSPDDSKLYVLTGNGVNENCQTAPSKMLVFARGPFSLTAPEREIHFTSDLQFVQKIRFDRSGKLYALGVKNGGEIVINVYASPALGGSTLTLLHSISVDAQLKAYKTTGFAVQVVPNTGASATPLP